MLSVLQEKMATCPFEEEDGQFCPGEWHVVAPSDESRPFVGCTQWKPGDPRTCEGGHNAAYIRDSVDPDLLEMYRTEGAASNTVADRSCTFIASKCYKGKGCDRHGGLETPVEGAVSSSCSVRARLLYRRVTSDPPAPGSFCWCMARTTMYTTCASHQAQRLSTPLRRFQALLSAHRRYVSLTAVLQKVPQSRKATVIGTNS